jgi:hypothetical protein
MNGWYIPEDMQAPTIRKGQPIKKANLFFTLFLPFSLAILGIPVYILIVLKLIDLIG